MSDWKECVLVDVSSNFAMGPFGSNIKAENFIGSGVPVIRGKNLNFDKYVDGEFVYLSEEKADELKNSNCYPGDLVFTHRGTIGQVCMVPTDVFPRYVVSQSGMKVTVDPELLDNHFLFYFFKSDIGQYELLQNESQVGVPAISSPLSSLKNVNLFLPPLPEQKAIAEILCSLDDKIDLLHRQNITLEQMAETLFRQWFIEEAEDEWDIRPLGELVVVKRGGSPRPIQEFLSETGLRWLKISDATKEEAPYIFHIKEHIKEEGLNKTTLLKSGSLVLSNSATPGIPKILQVDSCIHDGWLHFPESHFSNEFLYLLFKKIRPELLQHGNGSIFTNLKTDILKEYPIPIADDDSLEAFDSRVKPLFDKILQNQKQIHNLEKLRDTLLPKLMSGEVRVNK